MTFAGPRESSPDEAFHVGRQLKVEHSSFGFDPENRLSIRQHLLKIDAEIQKLRQLVLRIT